MADNLPQMRENSVAALSDLSEPLLTAGRVLILIQEHDRLAVNCIDNCRAHIGAQYDYELAVVSQDRIERMALDLDSSSGLLPSISNPDAADTRSSVCYDENHIEQLLHHLTAGGVQILCAPSYEQHNPIHIALALTAREAVRRLPGQCKLIFFSMHERQAGHEGQELRDITEPNSPRDPKATDLSYHKELTLDAPIAISPFIFEFTEVNEFIRPLTGVSAKWSYIRNATRDHPLVSVIIRSTNRPELADALDSLAMQTYPAIEVIIVDVNGHNAFDPGLGCGPYSIRIATSGSHLGRGAAANLGLIEANGDFVIFLDDDDWFLPNHISSLVDEIGKHPHVNAAYAGVDCMSCNESGDWGVLHTFNLSHDPIRLLIENYLPIHAVLFSRSLIGDDLLFDENLEVYEDWDFWIKLSLKTYFIHINHISAIYRICGGSGFGVQGNESTILEGLHKFFAKWRNLWTLDQVVAITRFSIEHAHPNCSVSPNETSPSLLIAHIRDGLGRLTSELSGRRAHPTLIESVQRLENSSRQLLDCFSDLDRELQEASDRLLSAESKSVADRQRIDQLGNVCMELQERIKSIVADQIRANDRVQSCETQRDKDLLRFFDIQRSSFWPLFQRLQYLGPHPRNVSRLIVAATKVIYWGLTFRLPSALRRRSLCKRLLASGLFDERWYSRRYPEVLFTGYRPIYHWLILGWQKGFDPHPLFITHWYLEKNLDVTQAGINPLIHYLDMGGGEGRDPHPFFDSDWYLDQYPDVASAGLNPLSHFILQGYREGRSPHPWFDLGWYLKNNPDVASSGANPLIQYVEHGRKEGRPPHPLAKSIDPFTDVEGMHEPSIAGLESKNQDNILIRIESGSEGSLYAKDILYLKGWLIAASGIDRAQVFVDGQACATIVRSIERPDVTAMYPDIADALLCGFELEIDVTSNSPGVHALMIKVLSGNDCELIRKLPLLIQDTIETTPDSTPLTDMQEEFVKPDMISLLPVNLDHEAENISFPVFKDPEITILIPVFNQIRYTICCLKSIAAHSPKVTTEIIVVDDCSTDDTERLLSKIKGITYLRNKSNLGFLLSVNHAARKARGRYLHLLNNDTQVQEGWLDSLLAVFKDDPLAGIVGSKLIYPSGHLQEAGAALKRDGQVDLIGLNENPLLPNYNFRRRVDHCSGASILIERDLFFRLGGLDEAFAPAYYEDCDLSLRAQAIGRHVVYEPRSLVIHHLSVSTAAQPKEKMSLIAQNRVKYLDRWQAELADRDSVRLIAFFLPQYHPIPENDLWWGKGFTEWTNVTRAFPNYIGHQQPHLPADLGFYDLRLPEVRQAQADLARRYGVYGFCYYNYWFNGHRLLHQPIDAILDSGEPDFPYCICWANENWTRRWDGSENEILISQNYSDSDNLAYIQHLDPWLRDPRYIRINGRPLLLVYRVELLPNPNRTAEIWREYCVAVGIGDIYLAIVESFGCSADPRILGFDAVVEFPPHGRATFHHPQPEIINQQFSGVFYDYPETAANFYNRHIPDYPFFRTAMPAWDNTARRQNNAHIFVNSNPEMYEEWLQRLVSQTRAVKEPGERFVFINAWNEWAEGNHLEPDQFYGHAYLEATRRALGTLLPPGYGDENTAGGVESEQESLSTYLASQHPFVSAAEECSNEAHDPSSARKHSVYSATAKSLAPGALLVGHPYAVLGRAEDIRTAACAFHAASIPFALRNLFGGYGRQWAHLHKDFPLLDHEDPTAAFRANIFLLNANEMASVPEQLGGHFMSGHYNIGYWAWELSIFPDAWLPAHEGLQEVWAPSRFIQSALMEKVNCPVTWMPLAVEPGLPPALSRHELGLPENRFLFLFFFDFRSFVSRKNPLAVIQAFKNAFPPGDDRVGLVIKTNGMDECPEAVQAFNGLEFNRDSRILMISRVMDDREIKALMNQCDCFVSLHRSEGFGRGLAEAMYLGKPVIGTSYSGNLDFMNQDNACLVDYRLISVKEDEYPFGFGQVWADPDIEMAAHFMRKLVEDPNLARLKSHLAARDIRIHNSFQAVGMRYRQRLESLGLIQPLA